MCQNTIQYVNQENADEVKRAFSLVACLLDGGDQERKTETVVCLSLLYSNISMRILSAVVFTFLMVLTGRICGKIKSLFNR